MTAPKQCAFTSPDGSRCSAAAGHEPLTASDGSTWAHGRPEFGHYWDKISDRPDVVSQPWPLTGEDATAPITITVEINFDLTPGEVWPDGDIPTGWTPADVLELVKRTGMLERFLSEWASGLGGDVTVNARGGFVNGHLR